jgi:N-acetyl sugar amidotransferase
MSIHSYRICTRCVMDTSAGDITFDENGFCNYCREFLERSGHVLFMDEAERSRKREVYLARVKADGRGKKYDCIIGLSGGVDSSWVLYLAVKCGLRPLAVHMDNGWDTELAQHNIENLVQKLGIDLQTHVIDWDEYREMMQAFFKADVIDIELLYDNAMIAVNYRQARKWGVKHILAGTNTSTEGMAIPREWNWNKLDARNIWAIWKRFGNGRNIETFPAIGVTEYIYCEHIRRIRWANFLDYFQYNKAESLRVLTEAMGYNPYPYKHYESVFTRFYQGYILLKKFGVDKRRVHLSTLIVSGQMIREEALLLLEHIPYPSNAAQEADIQYFLKKMGWTGQDLETYLSQPEKPHAIYGTETGYMRFAASVYRWFVKR